MSYATIEERVHDLLTDALDSDIPVTRGAHAADATMSVKLSPGSADRAPFGERGRVSHWTVMIEMRTVSGVSTTDWHNDTLELRQSIVDCLDKYPTLNQLQGVTGAMLSTLDEPTNEIEGRAHTFAQVARLAVTEHVTISGGEYGG